MKAVERLCAALRWVAVAALVAMMLVTIVDVTMRNTINRLVLGGVELVELALVATVYFALPETFLRGEHVTVDLVDQVAPRAAVRLRKIGALLTLALLASLTWRMALPALDTLGMGDRTSDLGIRLIWYWLPLVVGGVASVVAAAVVVWREYSSEAPAAHDADAD
jgi:TRAP-type C4-dicarboxylate transport system permease small subunit